MTSSGSRLVLKPEAQAEDHSLSRQTSSLRRGRLRQSLVLGLLALIGCDQPKAATPGPNAPTGITERTATVTTVKPERKSFRRVIEQPAHVEAFEETPIFARISGYIQKVHVDIGDRVTRDQVLAELWIPEMEQEVAQKRALVEKVQAEVGQAEAARKAAEALARATQAKVEEASTIVAKYEADAIYRKSEHERQLRLHAAAGVQKDIVDEKLNQLRSAEASLAAAKTAVATSQANLEVEQAKLVQAKADVDAAKARLRVANADLKHADIMLKYGKITAPYDGVITSRNIHTGHYLPGTGARPLFVVARTDTVRILVDVPEADAMVIRAGVPARVRCQIIKDQEFEGKVTRSSWSLDAKARTLRTEIDLPNTDDKLRPGMYAHVTFLVELPGTFTLPASAVLTQAGESFCYSVENGKGIRTLVKLGAREGQLVQVLKKRNGSSDKRGTGKWEDFSGNEEVVLTGLGSLSDGQPVVQEKR